MPGKRRRGTTKSGSRRSPKKQKLDQQKQKEVVEDIDEEEQVPDLMIEPQKQEELVGDQRRSDKRSWSEEQGEQKKWSLEQLQDWSKVLEPLYLQKCKPVLEEWKEMLKTPNETDPHLWQHSADKTGRVECDILGAMKFFESVLDVVFTDHKFLGCRLRWFPRMRGPLEDDVLPTPTSSSVLFFLIFFLFFFLI